MDDERLLKIAVLLGRAEGLLATWIDRKEATDLVHEAHHHIVRAVRLVLEPYINPGAKEASDGEVDGG